MKLWIGFILVPIILNTGCSSLSRSNQYGQNQDLRIQKYMTATDIKDKEVGQYELGYNGYARPLDESEYSKLQTRIFVKQLERNLRSKMDKNLYFQNKPFFQNDHERIEFLRISDYNDKLKWLRAKNFQYRISSYSSDEQGAIEQNDILLHMSMNAVKESWGEPDSREISGSEYHGNERWTYHSYQSTPEGYSRQFRTIFFQNGRVVAWKTK